MNRIKGSTEFNGQLDDVKMFQQQFMDAMQVPNCRWNDTESPTNYATTPEQMLSEISFQKLCKRLAQKFADELILHTFIQQLRLRDYDKKYLDSSVYNITLNGANDFQKLRELAHAEKVGGLIGTFSQFLPTLTNSKDSSEDLQPIFSKPNAGMSETASAATSNLLTAYLHAASNKSQSCEVGNTFKVLIEFPDGSKMFTSPDAAIIV
jgi:hypothetical protein